MIYYGLLILKPSIFLFATCLLCSIVALATGSSWTTAGTIGVAMIGVATGLGIPTGMAAGAVVSGAYFGDKMSPLSDTTNLAPAMAGTTLFEHIRHMVYTVTPSLCIALVLYLILGMRASGSSMDIVEPMREACKMNFNINPFMLIPPLLVIVMVALKIPALPGIMGGVFIGMLIGSIFNGVALADWPGIIHYGYSLPDEGAFSAAFEAAGGFDLVDMDSAEFNELAAAEGFSTSMIAEYNIGALLHGRGGMDGMMWTINLIICAMCFGGIMDASGMLGTLAEALLVFAKGRGPLVVVTVLSCLIMNIIAGDQYLAIVLPGRMYKTTFEDLRLAPQNLSRALEDAGTITSPLVPWNTCGATMSNFLGVKPWGPGGYGMYAFLNYINPLVSIFYGFTGITMTKMTDEQYEHILKEREREKAEALEALEA
jgi:NhaC family Na+:H+ antiporter